MKLSTRLVLLSMVMSALLIAVGLVGLQGMGASNDSLKTVYEDRTVCLGQLADIQYRMVANAYLLGQVSDLSTPDDLKRVGDQLDDNMATINKVWREYMSTYLTPEEAELAEAFAKLRGEYVNTAVKPGLAAVRAANITEVQHINDTVVSGALRPAKEQIAKLIQLQLDVASAEYERSVGNYGVVRNVAVASIVGGVLFAVTISYFLISGLRRSLAMAVHVSRTVANGDLSAVVDTRGKDELSTLMTAMSDMQANLIKVVSQVRKGSESVANAAREIAQGNHDLSERTETQAGSVEETATAMQQLGAQVRQNAENARLANGLAQSAVKVANEGGDVVGRVVETMRGINDSSRKIADIIGVIDGMPFRPTSLPSTPR